MGRDQQSFAGWNVPTKFQSTLPAWGETGAAPDLIAAVIISIHSPRMGRDNMAAHRIFRLPEISIHSPRMGRDGGGVCRRPPARAFQSTLPAWGETAAHGHLWPETWHFNPLSPHGERRDAAKCMATMRYFNPLSPHRERHYATMEIYATSQISIHSPRMGRDGHTHADCSTVPISIHSPRMGRDMRRVALHLSYEISIHSPRMGRDACPSAA